MNKRILSRLFLLPVLLTVLLVPAFSQVSLQVGAGGGLRVPTGLSSGTTLDYYAGTGYGLSSGYTLQTKARVGLAGFTLVGTIEYGRTKNSGEAEPGRGWIDLTQSIVTIKAGPEFTISIPAAPVTPYLGANLAWHSIGGSVTFIGASKVPSGSFDVQTVSRMGVGFNAGAVIRLGGSVSLDLGAEYAFVNVFGKEWTVAVPTNDARLNSYLSLNDRPDPFYTVGDTKHFVNGSRSMAMFEATATVMFGL